MGCGKVYSIAGISFDLVMIKQTLIVLAAMAFAAIAGVIIPFNIKRLRVIRAASRATRQQLEELYLLVEACGTESPDGFVLGRTNEAAPDLSCRLGIPPNFKGFPWTGKVVVVEADKEVRFRFVSDSPDATQLLGKRYRAVAVPKVLSKTGKQRNLFTPARYVKLNSRLAAALCALCPHYPSELLSYLLSAGLATFEFDGINQGRIGTTPAWIQDPEFPICTQCGRRMTLILQLPGGLLHKKAFQEATFYLFGCKQHPENIQSIEQYS